MSSVTTTSVKTANGTTPLTLSTGNTAGPQVVINGTGTLVLKANSSTNGLFVNTTAVGTQPGVTFASNSAAITNFTGNKTFTGNTNFTSNTIFNSTLTATQTIRTNDIQIGSQPPSIATEGHTRLPGGLLMQWGARTFTGNSAANTIVFGVPFAATPYCVQVTAVGQAANGRWGACESSNTTAINIRPGTNTAMTLHFLVIGV